MSVTKKEIRTALAAYLRASFELNDDNRLNGVEPYQFADEVSRTSTFSA